MLLVVVKHIQRVQNRWRVEAGQALGRVLFEILLREDVLDLVVETAVVHESWVTRLLEVGLQTFVLLGSQHNLLNMQHITEFLARHIALPEDVVILEEFKEADAILLALVLNFPHERFVRLIASEVGECLAVGRLLLGSGAIDLVREAVGVSEEVGVADLAFSGAIDRAH